jgi:hypothetical protein
MELASLLPTPAPASKNRLAHPVLGPGVPGLPDFEVGISLSSSTKEAALVSPESGF